MLGKFSKKNPFDINIFLSHMEHGRKILNEFSIPQAISVPVPK